MRIYYNSNLLLNLFLWFRITTSRNGECFDQSCVNRTESVHETFRFLYLSHPLYRIWVKIFIMNRYISKSYTTSKNTIDRQYTEQGSCSVNYYKFLFIMVEFEKLLLYSPDQVLIFLVTTSSKRVQCSNEFMFHFHKRF